MPRQLRYSLVFAPETLDHLDAIELKFHRLTQRVIDEQLSFTPHKQTHNRKPLEGENPFGATWELRCGPRDRFRELYEVEAATREVRILAIGVKAGNRLLIGGKEIEL